jgi:hypothetical protein
MDRSWGAERIPCVIPPYTIVRIPGATHRSSATSIKQLRRRWWETISCHLSYRQGDVVRLKKICTNQATTANPTSNVMTNMASGPFWGTTARALGV